MSIHDWFLVGITGIVGFSVADWMDISPMAFLLLIWICYHLNKSPNE